MSLNENDDLEVKRVRELQALVEERDARLAQLTATVGQTRHEINNALTGILGQSQLLLREELSEKARNRIETIQRLANRISETVATTLKAI